MQKILVIDLIKNRKQALMLGFVGIILFISMFNILPFYHKNVIYLEKKIQRDVYYHKYNQALVSVNKLLPVLFGKDRREYKFLKGYLFYKLGYDKKAIRQLNHSVNKGEVLYDFKQFLLGNLYYKNGDFVNAEKSYKEQLDNQYFHDLDLYSEIQLLRMILKKGDIVLIEEKLLDILKRFSLSSNSSDLYTIIRQLLKDNPKNPKVKEITFLFVDRLFAAKYYDLAYNCLKVLNALDLTRDEDVKTTYLLAQIQLSRNQFVNAKANLKTVYHLNKFSDYASNALFDLSNIARKQNNLEEEKQYLKMLQQSYPHSKEEAAVLFRLAQNYEATGQKDEAIKAYKLVFKKYPEHNLTDESLFQIGLLYFQKSNFDASYRYFDNLVARNKSIFYLPGLYWKAHAAGKLGKNVEAKQIYLKIQEQFPYSYYSYRVYERFGYKLKPVKVLAQEKMMKFTKYDVLVDLGMFDSAADQLNNAIEFLPEKSVDRKKLRRKLIHIYGDYDQYYSAFLQVEKAEDDSDTIEAFNYNLADRKGAYPQKYFPLVKKEALKNGIDPYFLLSIIREESKFRVDAKSRSGALGLMQLMPDTAAILANNMGVEIRNRDEFYAPIINIMLGSRYVKEMLDTWKNNKIYCLASYNGGPNNVEKWMDKNKVTDEDFFYESIPIDETKNYVKKVLVSYWAYKLLYGSM